jgi:hypothetical protein
MAPEKWSSCFHSSAMRRLATICSITCFNLKGDMAEAVFLVELMRESGKYYITGMTSGHD